MRLIILGAGGYGQMVGDIASQSQRYEKIIYLDDNPHSDLASGRLEDFRRYISEDTEFYPAFGNNEGRLQWLDRLSDEGGQIATLVHGTAYVSPTAALADGVVILPMAVINTGCFIQRGCLINSGAVVDHNCILEEGAHICIGALVKAENRIPKCMKVEAGQVIPNRQYPLQ